MENEVIETRAAKIWLGKDGIIRAICFPNAKITLEDAKEQVAVADKLRKRKRVPVFVDMGKILSIDREARRYFTEANEKYHSAVALLVGSSLSKMVGNFFIGLDKGVIPRKLFTSEARAIEWLKGFVE